MEVRGRTRCLLVDEFDPGEGAKRAEARGEMPRVGLVQPGRRGVVGVFVEMVAVRIAQAGRGEVIQRPLLFFVDHGTQVQAARLGLVEDHVHARAALRIEVKMSGEIRQTVHGGSERAVRQHFVHGTGVDEGASAGDVFQRDDEVTRGIAVGHEVAPRDMPRGVAVGMRDDRRFVGGLAGFGPARELHGHAERAGRGGAGELLRAPAYADAVGGSGFEAGRLTVEALEDQRIERGVGPVRRIHVELEGAERIAVGGVERQQVCGHGAFGGAGARAPRLPRIAPDQAGGPEAEVGGVAESDGVEFLARIEGKAVTVERAETEAVAEKGGAVGEFVEPPIVGGDAEGAAVERVGWRDDGEEGMRRNGEPFGLGRFGAHRPGAVVWRGEAGGPYGRAGRGHPFRVVLLGDLVALVQEGGYAEIGRAAIGRKHRVHGHAVDEIHAARQVDGEGELRVGRGGAEQVERDLDGVVTSHFGVVGDRGGEG